MAESGTRGRVCRRQQLSPFDAKLTDMPLAKIDRGVQITWAVRVQSKDLQNESPFGNRYAALGGI